MSDDVGGDLFLPIPSKEHDLDIPSLKSNDDEDGTLFPRKPSQKDASGKGQRPRESEYREKDDSNDTFECTIRPVHSSDDGSICIASSLNDPFKENIPPYSLYPSDSSDAVMGSSKDSDKLDVERREFKEVSKPYVVKPTEPSNEQTPSEGCYRTMFSDSPKPTPCSSSISNDNVNVVSRKPSQKDASGREKRSRESEYTKKDDGNDTLECSIMPLDLRDDDNICTVSDNYDSLKSNCTSRSYYLFDEWDLLMGSRKRMKKVDETSTDPEVIDQPNHDTTTDTSTDPEVIVQPNDDTTTDTSIKQTLPEEPDGTTNCDSPMPAPCCNCKCCNSTRCNVTKALIFPIVSLIIYFWDIGSDISLAVDYSENGDDRLFYTTLVLILLPHVATAFLDTSWVCLDRHLNKIKGKAIICKIVLSCLTLGRVFRAFNYIYHLCKFKLIPKSRGGTERSRHKNKAREEKRDFLYLDFISTFMESAPQFLVQLYLYYAYDLELTVLRVITLLTSWISIAWTYAAYYRSNREVYAEKQDVNLLGFICFFFSVLSALAVRFICMALFLVNMKLWASGLSVFVHFLVMFFYIVCLAHPQLEGVLCKGYCRGCARILYYLFFAYVHILCFMNLTENNGTKTRMCVFYIIIYLENIVMVVLDSILRTFNVERLILLVGFTLVHVILLMIYYRFLHPKRHCNYCKVFKVLGLV